MITPKKNPTRRFIAVLIIIMKILNNLNIQQKENDLNECSYIYVPVI